MRYPDLPSPDGADMRKPTHPIIVVALASVLVAPPLCAFAQQRPDLQHQYQQKPQAPQLQGTKRGPTVTPRQHIQTRNPPSGRVGPGPHGARLTPGPPPPRNFRGQVYHGRLAWEHGRWHHQTRKGRLGWWWDVGGVWYFYAEPVEGPPNSVSDIEVEDEGTAEPAPPPEEPHQAFYYRPGDLKGTAYQTIEECSQARQQAGDVGVCVLK